MPKSRQTCTQCSLRRQKCDRLEPCGRCVKRGIPQRCTREWTSQSEVGSGTPSPQTPVRHTPARDSRRRPYPSYRDSTDPRDTFLHSRVSTKAAEAVSINEATASSSSHQAVDSVISNNTATDLEFASLGRDRPSGRVESELGPPVVEIAQPGEAPNSLPWTFSKGFGSFKEGYVAILQLQLPNLTKIWHLVDYHERALLWYHGAYHGPTFRGQLEDAVHKTGQSLSIKDLNLQWVALLFSVMTGSLACATGRTLDKWGFSKAETPKLCHQWYKASIMCLNLAEYTANHQIFSVHAITTLTMSAHTLGFSAELAVLLGSALKVAQSLGLDRLAYDANVDDIMEASTQVQRTKVLKREVARRLWSQLCIQDWLSLPFADSHCINPLHFTTTKPSNRDYITMDHLPESFPTYISYGNYLYDIAKLIAEHHAATLQSSTTFNQFESVIDFDTRMRELATREMPPYFHVTKPIDPSWPAWVPWARRSLTICFAHKVMMIHRAFIGQSFTNPALAVTRMTCIAASKTILREAKQERAEDGPIIWIDQAFCVAAGIFLCLDIFHRPEDDAEYGNHVDLVKECIAMLQQFDNSMIAMRGAKLLSCLLSERSHGEGGQGQGRRLDTESIAKSVMNAKAMASRVSSPRGRSEMPAEPFAGTLDIYKEQGYGEDEWVLPAELFPPQAGFSNSFLFDDLFNDSFE